MDFMMSKLESLKDGGVNEKAFFKPDLQSQNRLMIACIL
jgi:hypothetical protein